MLFPQSESSSTFSSSNHIPGLASSNEHLNRLSGGGGCGGVSSSAAAMAGSGSTSNDAAAALRGAAAAAAAASQRHSHRAISPAGTTMVQSLDGILVQEKQSIMSK